MKRAASCFLLTLVGILAACSSDEEAPGEVEILSFQASPETIAPGFKSVLSWKATNAEKVEIVVVGGERLLESVKNEGRHEVSPKETTTYLLRATGASGTPKESTVELKVGEVLDPVIPEVTFGSDASRIDFEASTRLTWTAQDATRVLVKVQGGEVLFDTDTVPAAQRVFSGDLEVTPARWTIYEITAVSADGGEAKATAEVVVDPVIVTFGTTTVGPVDPGTESEIFWETKGADTLAIVQDEGQEFTIAEADRAAGSIRLPVGRTGTFHLEATRGLGQASRVLTIDVLSEDMLRIVAFTASPNPVQAGEPTTLSWRIEYAHLAWFGTGSSFLSMVQIPSEQIAEGSAEVTPEGPGPVVYRLTARNSGLGVEVSAEETIEIL